MSCSVTTQPPSGRGWIETESMRPSPGRLTRWLTACAPRARACWLRTSSAVMPPNRGRLAMRYSTISRSVVPDRRCLRLEAVDLGVAVVGNHQTLLGVEHGEALRHVRKRHVELGVLRLRLALVSSTLLRSVMSSWMAIQPPSSVGWREIEYGSAITQMADLRPRARAWRVEAFASCIPRSSARRIEPACRCDARRCPQ